MTNITLSTQHYRIHRSDVEPVRKIKFINNQ
ncbi:hypothetical protein DBK41_11950 [Salmonella enterica subsp. enterica serovar Typhi]|nr:hypothetical protein DBK41_11950 [Salmonella enterica subsp. enterica serovar Typhi]